MIKDKIFAYSWNIDDEQDERTIIRIYGLDEHNNNVCVKIKDFTPYVYAELPTDIEWNEVRANMLVKKIDEICGKYKPLKKTLKLKKKLYFANMTKNKDNEYKYKLFPYLMLSFSTANDRKNFIWKVKRKILVPGLGYIKLKIHEQDASPILQLTCVKDIPTAGWIYFAGKKVEKDNKETYCEKEYIVKWKNLAKYSSDIIPKPLIMGFDIEVYSGNPNKMPDVKKPGDKIFQICCILSRYGDDVCEYQKYLLTLGDPDQKVVGKDTEIRKFTTETNLLIGFTEFIIEKNPQILVGYNILNFDIPYMIERSKDPCMCIYDFDKMSCRINHHAKEKIIKWSSSAYKNQEFKFLDAEGRLFVDLLPLVKRDYKFSKYNLKTVSTFFLGETKDPLTPKGIFKCYDIGIKRNKDKTYSARSRKAMGVVGKYCVVDGLLCNRLFETLQTWVGLCEMATTCNVPIFYLYTQGQQIKVYSQVYKKCMYDNFVVEKDGYIPDENEQYTGATVFEPIAGAYDKVVPFDFASLYPTTIIAYNIDYSTLVRDDTIPDSDCNIFEWEDHVGCEHDKQVRKTKPKQIICAKRYYRFLKKPKGVMPALLEFLLGARKETRKEIKVLKKKLDNIEDKEEIKRINTKITVLNKRQLAYKVSANSMYGAMGVRRGYLPFLPGAMCTTARGRESIQKAAAEIQKNHRGSLIYGDTDSAYITFPHLNTSQEIWDYCLQVEEKVSELYPKPMKLEFEEVIYWRFFILTKKRYMYLECGRDGKLSDKIGKKGVLLARRDNSAFIRNIYAEIIMMIFNRATKEQVLYKVLQEINKLCSATFNHKDFIVTKSVGEVSGYKIRPLPEDPKKRKKRLKDLNIMEEWSQLPPSRGKVGIFKNKLEEIYSLKSLPSQVQLAEKMRRRGMRIDAGSRLEYLVTDTGNIKDKLCDKIEDPKYQQEHSDLIKIDYMYYLKLASNSLDQAIIVAYKEKDFVLNQYKFRLKRMKVLDEIRNIKKHKIKFIE